MEQELFYQRLCFISHSPIYIAIHNHFTLPFEGTTYKTTFLKIHILKSHFLLWFTMFHNSVPVVSSPV